MDKTFKKRVFAGAVAALIMAGSAQIVGIETKAASGENAGKATADTKYTLDDFDDYDSADALYKDDGSGAYELFDNWDSEKVQSKFGSNFNRVTDKVTCEVENMRFKFNYNLDTDKNNDFNDWGWATQWEQDGAHCGFLHQQYIGDNKHDFSQYDGIEFEIEGFGSENTFYIQVGYVQDVYDDNANARFKYPIYLGFTGTKTVKVPFDVLAATDHSHTGELYGILGNVDRFSFYINRKGSDYVDGKIRIGKDDKLESSVYIDNIGLYKAADDEGKYVDVDDSTPITYDGKTKTLSDNTDFDVILARGIESITITPKASAVSRATPVTLVNGTDFTNDVVGFSVNISRDKLIEKCEELGNGEYVLTFNFEDSTKEGFKDNGWGNETDTVNLSITNVAKATDEHQHNYDESTWESDDTDHWHECTTDDGTTCDVKVQPDSKKPHNYGEWVTVTEPTESTEGSRKRECTDCGYVQTEVIPATGTGNDDPEDSNSTPENSNGTPGNSNSAPENSSGTPENSNGTPENSNGTSENSNNFPENANNSTPGNNGGNPDMGITGGLVPAVFAAACITLVMARKNKK